MTPTKISIVKQAARHVARQRMIKRAYDDDWVEMVKYLAETGQLAPESVAELKKLHDQGMLSKVLQGAANGAVGWGTGSALATGLWSAINGASALGGALRGGGIGLGLGSILGGIGAGWNYKKEKEQLKSILDSLPPEAIE